MISWRRRLHLIIPGYWDKPLYSYEIERFNYLLSRVIVLDMNVDGPKT